jgi:hypothetical protein
MKCFVPGASLSQGGLHWNPGARLKCSKGLQLRGRRLACCRPLIEAISGSACEGPEIGSEKRAMANDV